MKSLEMKLRVFYQKPILAKELNKISEEVQKSLSALAEEVYKTAIDKADAEYISCLLAK